MFFRSTLLFLATAIPALFAAEPRPVLNVTGGTIRGELLDPRGAVFKGIPYARPPVGALRWREPAPVESWSGVREATAYGLPCAQNSYPGLSDSTTSEDCLYLNVWTPVWPAGRDRRPVMVWIPGGGNYGGSNDQRNPGDQLIRHDVIVVSLHYRVGYFGFFSHPALTREALHHASGNQGILDQIAALHWIHENIAKFGGDPENVTIAGESAGSFDASVLMTSPLARGLFRRVIGQSGAVVLVGEPLSLADAEKRGVSLAATWDAKDVTSLQELRAVPARVILADGPKFLASPQPNLGLVIDGYVFPKRPADVFTAGAQLRVDMLLGNLAHEWIPGVQPPQDVAKAVEETYATGISKRALALYQTTDPLYGSPGEQWLEDIGFRCSTVAQLLWHAAAGNRAYEYQFDRRPRTVQRNNVHAGEIAYAFGVLGSLRSNGVGPVEPIDFELSEAMQKYWTNFVKTGNPNGPGLANWPRFDITTRPYLALTDTGAVTRENLRRPHCDLWMENLKPARSR